MIQNDYWKRAIKIMESQNKAHTPAALFALRQCRCVHEADPSMAWKSTRLVVAAYVRLILRCGLAASGPHDCLRWRATETPPAGSPGVALPVLR
jgi:hypothetical protein